MDKLGNTISNILNHKMKKFNLKPALTILTMSLLMPVFGQDINPWGFKISAEKDTIETGEKYTAYVIVKNKDIDSSKIEVTTNGVQLKRDTSDRFIYQQVIPEFEPALLYKKVNLEFKIKCPYMKENVSLVHFYYIKDKNSLVDDRKDEGFVCRYFLPGLFQYPEFISSKEYPTFNDYIISEIKEKKVVAKGPVDIQVIVSKDGTLNYEKVLKGEINKRNLNKIIKIINNSPNWRPGEEDGRKINIKKIIPIRFN